MDSSRVELPLDSSHVETNSGQPPKNPPKCSVFAGRHVNDLVFYAKLACHA